MRDKNARGALARRRKGEAVANADGPSSSSQPAADLAARAIEFYGNRPGVDWPMRSPLLNTDNAYLFRSRRLAEFLLPAFADRYRAETDAADRIFVIRAREDDPTVGERVTRETLGELVAEALQGLPDAPDDASRIVAKAVRDTRALAAFGTRPRLVVDVVDCLTRKLALLPPLDPAPVVDDGRPRTTEAERRAAARDASRERRATERERDRPALVNAAEWSINWREASAPGAYRTSDVHSAYAGAVLDPVGRTKFHQITGKLVDRRRRADGAAYVVRQGVVKMDRAQKKALAALIVDNLTIEWRAHALDGLADLVADRQAERDTVAPVAAPAPAGHAHVVSLDSRRRARAS